MKPSIHSLSSVIECGSFHFLVLRMIFKWSHINAGLLMLFWFWSPRFLSTSFSCSAGLRNGKCNDYENAMMYPYLTHSWMIQISSGSMVPLCSFDSLRYCLSRKAFVLQWDVTDLEASPESAWSCIDDGSRESSDYSYCSSESMEGKPCFTLVSFMTQFVESSFCYIVFILEV